MSRQPTLGIDLGTTNSAVAVIEDGHPQLLRNTQGEFLTPSVVRFPPADDQRTEPYVGQEAINAEKQHPDRTIRSVKRKMGSDWTVEFSGTEYTPPEISAYILRELKQGAATSLGETVSPEDLSEAVITVPAYFTEDQRQATKAAGRMAGFESVELLNEPTAVALSAGYADPDTQQTALVYDLGGGTFDASVLEIGVGNNTFRVQATGGDRSLGGDDWDDRLLTWATETIERQHGRDPCETHPTDAAGDHIQREVRLRSNLRDAKERVCHTQSVVDISLPFFMQGENGEPVTVDLSLDHDTFQTRTTDLTEETLDPVRDTIDQADYTVPEIDTVLLAGGATRMPQVTTQLETLFGEQIPDPADPDHAVAKGAAIHAGDTDVLLQDVTPLSLGINTDGGKFERIIPRNSSLPTEESKVFTTSRPNQTQARIEVYQGESDIADNNRYLNTFFITGIGPAAPGIPQIRVTFRVDNEGILTAHATTIGGLSSQAESEVTIDAAPEITDEEIAAHIEQVEQQKEQTDKQVQLIAQRNQLEHNHQWATRLLANHSEALSHDQSEALVSLVEQAEHLLETDVTTISQLKDCNQSLEAKLTSVGSDAMTRQRRTNGPDTDTDTDSDPDTDTSSPQIDPATRLLETRQTRQTETQTPSQAQPSSETASSRQPTPGAFNDSSPQSPATHTAEQSPQTATTPADNPQSQSEQASTPPQTQQMEADSVKTTAPASASVPPVSADNTSGVGAAPNASDDTPPADSPQRKAGDSSTPVSKDQYSSVSQDTDTMQDSPSPAPTDNSGDHSPSDQTTQSTPPTKNSASQSQSTSSSAPNPSQEQETDTTENSPESVPQPRAGGQSSLTDEEQTPTRQSADTNPESSQNPSETLAEQASSENAPELNISPDDAAQSHSKTTEQSGLSNETGQEEHPPGSIDSVGTDAHTMSQNPTDQPHNSAQQPEPGSQNAANSGQQYSSTQQTTDQTQADAPPEADQGSTQDSDDATEDTSGGSPIPESVTDITGQTDTDTN